jgi:hypothetical protein
VSSTHAERFLEQGFTVVRSVLSAERVEVCIAELERLSGRSRASFETFRVGRGLLRRPIYRGWTLPDGVTRTRGFWPLLFLPALLDVVRELLGPRARFLQHTDLHVGFSAFNWHHDSVQRRLGATGDWDETGEPYRLARVGFYLQSHAESGFTLRFVPGSHRRGGLLGEASLLDLERRTARWRQAVALATGRDPLAREASAVATEPGDAVVFDPRILHAGSPFSGPKYSAFLAFGVPGRHFARHAHYYRHVRHELGYGAPDPELVERLRREGLFAELEHPATATGAAAYRPGMLERLLGRAIRPAG